MIGQISAFDVKNGNWSAYIERVEMYFLANKIEDGVKLPTLIAVMGEDSYDLLSTLASPKKPSSLTFKEVVNLMETHLQPKPSILAERYRFRQRRQQENESIADYVADLKKLSRFCDFSTTLEDNIRDQFVCGLKSESTRQRLFAEENLCYKKAVSLAINLEAAERDAGVVDRSLIVEQVNKMQIRECKACGDTNHRWEDCVYKNFVCSLCKTTGHLRRMCSGREKTGVRGEGVMNSYGYSGRSRGWRGRWRGKRGGRSRGAGRGAGQGAPADTYWLQGAAGCEAGPVAKAAPASEVRQQEEVDYTDEEPIYQMSLAKYKPVCISLLVNDTLLNMEIDTGSALSCISKSTFLKYFNKLKLRSCRLKLKFYDGATIEPLGYLEISVKYGNICKVLDLYVIDNGCTHLLGRQWLSELNIDIPKFKICNVNNVQASQSNDQINNILSRYKSVFDGTLGRYTGGTVALKVREDAEPIFCRARPLPFSMRARVDAELDAMLQAGVVEPVDHSDWATPLVIASKADGGIRICADYKVTLNRALMIDRYPVPRIDELFSDLSGNKYFTKIDLSQAYNQLELDSESKAYTVINTHKGLFKYNRLVYGLASSPGIFQKFMANLFKDIPDVITFYDDILLKSRDFKSHLETIEKVFSILQNNGLKIKKNKCNFLASEVKYLGYIIDKDGIRVDPDKVKAIVGMVYPKNVSELKSFLGMVNFYGKFIKNLSTHLAPLYELLKAGKQFIWSKESSLAFNKVKKLLCSAEVLVHFDISAESIVTCDASSYGVGCVLASRAPNGSERVVAYASRSLTPAERHYSQIHKEALAIIFAVDKFHQYLYGRKFTLKTDHKPLVSIFGPNSAVPCTAASRLQRWAIKLSAYDFNIEHIFSAPYHPASNGAAENAVKICKRVIKKAVNQKLDPDIALSRFLLAYRNTEHYTTGESPAKILLGRDLRMRLDALKPSRETRVQSHQARSEEFAGGARRQLTPGDPVWYRDYRSRDKWLAGQLTDRLGTTDYKVKSVLGTEVQRHIDQLRFRKVKVVDSNTGDINRQPSHVNPKPKSRSSLAFPTSESPERDPDSMTASSATADMLTSPRTVRNQRASHNEMSSPDGNTSRQEAITAVTVPAVSTPGGPIQDNVVYRELTSDQQTDRISRIRRPPRRYGFEDVFFFR
ncbi:uncharacterized protein K02A2.6-like isoform X1 [Pieris napi]|uniref:uncharacterized protein K02A2.6-like isoform X1 n=1 Tax=Pieris napi TaxID=78633 RepID=UPI001FB92D79|nr:uncharacterized protein K02A2.6-like isoform X1 [Pieris napi]XP_047518749.1 uncharacterized protein K02A2.6-like isoform X2 [Pieris napi]XP_047520686.1 uncharacterized protein K02A2.6-like isoform X1 [Pieris napi]